MVVTVSFPLTQPSSSALSNRNTVQGFPGGAVVENPPANAGDMGSSPGPGRSHIKKKKYSASHTHNLMFSKSNILKK